MNDTAKPPDLAFGAAITRRVAELAKISQSPHELTRVYLSPQHRAAADLLMRWMREAGMDVRMDAVGNVIGRYEADKPGQPALALGSHFDTVRDAGRWDGPLGIITAIACVDAINRTGRRFPFAVEVLAFADEEGVRFTSTLIGSRAVAGTLEPDVLEARDTAGISIAEALQSFGLDPYSIADAARSPKDFLGYVELHIEQGPVLENANRPVGVVTAISGATRISVTLEGEAGHAGTVPAELRRDALAGAAECVLVVETACRDNAHAVATVGALTVSPGAVNVIPGRAQFYIDLRCADDAVRHRVARALMDSIDAIANRRKLIARHAIIHDSRAAQCAPWLREQIAAAIKDEGYSPVALASGAGHDAMAMATLTGIGMIFVRCRGGVSHHPDEHVSVEDADAGARVLLEFVSNFGK